VRGALSAMIVGGVPSWISLIGGSHRPNVRKNLKE
jgi:hypothetical protein